MGEHLKKEERTFIIGLVGVILFLGYCTFRLVSFVKDITLGPEKEYRQFYTNQFKQK